MRRVVVLFAVFLLFFSFVVAQDTGVDVDSLVNDFLKIRSGSKDVGDIVAGLNALSGDDKNSFFTKLKDNSGIDFSKFGSGEFDSTGNFVLDNKRVVDFVDLYTYGVGVTDTGGESGSFSYEFGGDKYSADLPAITDIVVDGDLLTYTFDNGASIKLGSEESFDFENRMIMSGAGDKGVEWVNMKGALEVDSDGIKTSIVYDKDSETDLKDFPILKDSSGDIVSPYHGGRGLTIDLPSDFKKPTKEDMFTTFEKDGKVYSVNSEGGVREITNLAVKFNEDGEIASVSGGVIEKGDLGDIFVTDETLIARGESPPTDMSKSFIWFSEKDGNVMVSLNSVSGDLFYVQKQDLDDVSLNGNVVIKNGGYFLSSDKEGNINIRKVDGADSKMEFGIDTLHTELKTDEWFSIKEYEGDSEELFGSLVLYDNKGKLILGGVFGLSDLNIIKLSDPSSYSIATLQRLGGVGTPATQLHEGVHVFNQQLSTEYYSTHPESGIYEGDGWTGEGYFAIYLGDGEYSLIRKTSFETHEIRGSIPSVFKTGRYDLYVAGSQSSHELVGNILNEYTAYQAALKYRIDTGSELDGMRDYLLSNSELGIFSIAGAMKIKQDNPTYWNGAHGEQYKSVVNTMWARSLDYSNQVATRYGSDYTASFNTQLQQLRTSPSAASMRNFIVQEMPGLASELNL